jgi:hypothetical protein
MIIWWARIFFGCHADHFSVAFTSRNVFSTYLVVVTFSVSLSRRRAIAEKSTFSLEGAIFN